MVATRAAVDRCGLGHVHSPLSLTGSEGGQGRGGGHEDKHDALRPQPVLFSLHAEEPGGRRLPAWQSLRGHRNGSSSAPWNSSPTSCPWSRFWTFLWHRWWTSLWLRSCTSIRPIPEQVVAVPKISSSSRCSRTVLKGAADGGAVGGSATRRCREVWVHRPDR